MNHFNIRVYGVLIDSQNRVLVSDEKIRDQLITKFPGGGLEFGEGTRQCLEREFMEELGLKISTGEHIYTTDFFQISAYNSDHQIISIYYAVKALEPVKVDFKTRPFDFDEKQLQAYNTTGECEAFRLINLADINESVFHLPIDKVVANMLISKTSSSSL